MNRQRARERPEVEGAEEFVLEEAEARLEPAEDVTMAAEVDSNPAVAEVDSNSHHLTTFELETPRWSLKIKT